MSRLVAAPLLLPLAAAALSLVMWRRLWWQRVLGLTASATALAASVTLLIRVETYGTQVMRVGGWPPPAGITLVADRFSAAMLVVSALMALAVLLYAVGQGGTDERNPYFHPVYQILGAGVAGAFLTGDLFNLFVSFEVMLTASYVLITYRARSNQVRAVTSYVVISLLASALFLTSVALIYAATGTVNLADLATKLPALDPGLLTMLGLLLLVTFGIKAALFPLFFWLPDAYPTAPTPVTAIFAGLLTKVGVYAIIRTQTLFFGGDHTLQIVLMVLAGATMVFGVLGAISQNDIKRILSFHVISQIGYMIMGLSFFTAAGIAAAIVYILHHIVVKTTLFMVAGLIEGSTGTSSLRRLGGVMHTTPVVAVLFLPAALSLAGLPPFSGFVAKLALVQAGFGARFWIVTAVSLAVSLLTLFSMTKIWTGAFWGSSGDQAARPWGERRGLMVGATAALVLVSLALAAGAEPLLGFAQRAADQLLDPTAYVKAVLGG